MSRYSTSAKYFGSTHVAFGFLMALCSADTRIVAPARVMASGRYDPSS
jgi:hypothetical protein